MSLPFHRDISRISAKLQLWRYCGWKPWKHVQRRPVIVIFGHGERRVNFERERKDNGIFVIWFAKIACKYRRWEDKEDVDIFKFLGTLSGKVNDEQHQLVGCNKRGILIYRGKQMSFSILDLYLGIVFEICFCRWFKEKFALKQLKISLFSFCRYYKSLALYKRLEERLFR